MSDNEVEEVSFLPAADCLCATSKNKRAVYEPSTPQRCRQVICSKEMALTVGIVVCAVILAVAFIASFARPETPTCYTTTQEPVIIPPEEVNSTKPEPISYNGKLFPWNHIRLPNTIQPWTYDLFLHPNLTTTLVIGNVTILCQASSSTNFIVLHVDSMNITEITVHSHFNNEVIGTREVLFYQANSLMYIKLDRPLEVNELLDLRIYFRYHLLEILSGFYLSSYTAEDGSTRYLATTQFEASGARKAFPCFDEPQMKANFSLSMVREERHITLFNMPLKSTSAYMHGLTLDSFDATLKMSTYLVAFVVSDFVNQTKYSANGIQVRVFANKENIHLTSYALDNAVTILDYFEKFYGLPYPLPKLDLVAIPDFDAGAMENWGLMTFRTSNILYDPHDSTTHRKLIVAITIAHELAHQWFGNYVTMKWWNDLWLNEGFATFMGYIGANVINSDYEVFELFVLDVLWSGLKADSLMSSHPIEVQVSKPEDISSIFDLISYKKGGSIIRMMRHFLGSAVFEKRLNNYLNKYAYKNAQTDDLWEAMSGSSSEGDRLDVKTIMDTWTKQMGYPVVMVEIRGEQVTVKQERFLLSTLANTSNIPRSLFNYKWYIPMTYVSSTEPTNPHTVWLNMSSATFTVPEGTSWVKANYRSFGFYRVNYEEATWKALISELTTNHKVFQPEDRATLMDDLCNMARAGKVEYTLCLEVTEYLVQEDEYVPFTVGISNLLFMKKFMATLPTYEWYKNYILKLLSNQLKILGWKTDGAPLKRSLRSFVLKIAIEMGNRAIVNRGQEIFQEWRYNNRSIHPDLFDSVLLASMADGSSENWNYLWQTYTETSNPILKSNLLRALGRTPNANDLNRYLSISTQRDFIRIQDLSSVFYSLSSSQTGQLLAWRHLKLNWKSLQERFHGSTFGLSNIIESVIIKFVTEMDYHEVIEFFRGKDLGTSKRTVDNTIEVIRMNVDWMERNHVKVSKWFREHGQ